VTARKKGKSRQGIDPYYFSSEWKSLHAAVLKRDKFNCRYCGAKGSQADHVIPRKKGGPDCLDNLVCCCTWCNSMVRGNQFTSFEEKRAWLLKRQDQRGKNVKGAKGEALRRGVPVWVIYKEACIARKQSIAEGTAP
jgi:5-methylcytosine-specific restriction endonuclease McrA